MSHPCPPTWAAQPPSELLLPAVCFSGAPLAPLGDPAQSVLSHPVHQLAAALFPGSSCRRRPRSGQLPAVTLLSELMLHTSGLPEVPLAPPGDPVQPVLSHPVHQLASVLPCSWLRTCPALDLWNSNPKGIPSPLWARTRHTCPHPSAPEERNSLVVA